MRATRRFIVASVLAAVATSCGSSGDAGSSDDAAAGSDTRNDDTAPSDTFAGGDSTTPLDTATTDTAVSDGVGTDTATGDVGTDATLGPYPSGPYGKNAGDVIANLHWQGYANDAADAVVSTKPYGAYSMDDARRSGRRYALLHVSEFF